VSGGGASRTTIRHGGELHRRVQSYAREAARTVSRTAAGAAPPGSGPDDEPSGPLAVDEMRQRLDGRTWVQLRRGGDRLRAVVVDGRRAEVVDLGRATTAERESLFLRSALRRHLAVLTPATAELVAATARRLEQHVLAPLRLADGAVVLRPTMELQATPWAALPRLADTPFTVAPYALPWRRAVDRPTRGHRAGNVVLVAGPGLAHAGAEVVAVARHHAAAAVLVGASATVAAVVAAIDGADLVHLVCHGRISTRSPLLASLLLHDGQLFGRDIVRLATAPRLVVLPSCHGGLTAGCRRRQALGTLASLLAIGTPTVIAATLPVPDRPDTVEAMAGLHERLARGDRPSEALAGVRRSGPYVARAFSCMGAG
jgi:hypothetical protein